MSTPSRNEPCPCGSGKKFKHCHVDNIKGLETGRQGRDPVPLIIMALGAVIGLAIMGTSDVQVGLAVIGGGFLLALAYYIFRDPPASKGGGDPGAINFGG